MSVHASTPPRFAAGLMPFCVHRHGRCHQAKELKQIQNPDLHSTDQQLPSYQPLAKNQTRKNNNYGYFQSFHYTLLSFKERFKLMLYYNFQKINNEFLLSVILIIVSR